VFVLGGHDVQKLFSLVAQVGSLLHELLRFFEIRALIRFVLESKGEPARQV
jgi:hypothetical protein